MLDKDKIFKLFVDGKEIAGDKTKEEIAKITSPKTEFSFEANGVLMKKI